MTDPLHPPAPTDFDIDWAHAVLEWVGADSQLRVLYQSANDPSRQVTFAARFDASTGAAFFKIRAPVGLKAPGHAKTPLYLYIPPERITSLAYDVPDAAPAVAKQKLGSRPPGRFQFTLTQPADMVVPRSVSSLAPQNRSHGEMLDCLKLLAQETRFSVYLTNTTMSMETQFGPLCDAVATRALKSTNAAADLRGLYGGAGGRVLEAAELCTRAMPNTAPPAYQDLGPSPPEAPFMETGTTTKPTGSSRKRRRDSASSSAYGRPEPDMTAICKRMVDEVMSQCRHEERAYLDSQLAKLRSSLSADLQQLKSEMLDHVDQRLSDLEGTLCSIDNVDEHLSQHVYSFEDLIEVKIDDRVMGIKSELEDFVDNEVANAEERVLRRVRDASWTVALDE